MGTVHNSRACAADHVRVIAATTSDQLSANDLPRLASIVIGRVRPNRGDRYGRDDCWQTACVAGLEALRSAEQKQCRPSAHVLLQAMTSSVYRLLKKASDVCEVDLARSA